MTTGTIISLENAKLYAEFDLANGALIRLQNKLTGWESLRRRELGLSFLIEAPLPDRHRNYIHGTQQALASYAVADDGNSIRFVWDGLQSEHGGMHDIKFTAIVVLGDNGLTFTGEIENRSSISASVICYPCLGDITPASPEAKLERLYSKYSSLWARSSLYPTFDNDCGYWGFDHLGNNAAFTPDAFMMLAHEDQGFYFGAHDHTLREMVNYFFRFRPGYEDCCSVTIPKGDDIDGNVIALELFIAHFSYVNPGESQSLTPIVIQPYQGTWHYGLNEYKKWRETWFTPPQFPAWVLEPHSWQQIQINCADDSLRFRYTDLVEIGKECAEHGVSAIQLVGWNKGGQDCGNPSHDTDPRLGSWDELKQAIADVQALGVKIIHFSKFTWGDRSQPWYREIGHRYAVKDPYGDAYVHPGYHYFTFEQCADINTRRFSPMCPLSPEWRDVAAEEFVKVLDLGPAGMLYDECQHHAPARYCFDPSHGHHVPAFVYGGDISLCDRFLQESRERDADFLYAGEACYDIELMRYHLLYFRIGKASVHSQRYIDPYVPMMCAIYGFDDRNHLNKCLQHRYIISYEPYNFHGRLRDFPHTLAYGKLIDALRVRYRDYLWDAEYSDTVGARIMVAGQPYHDYTVYHQPNAGKRAVVIANTAHDDTITATVAFDSHLRGMLMQVTPEEAEARPADDAITILPRSVVIVFEA